MGVGAWVLLKKTEKNKKNKKNKKHYCGVCAAKTDAPLCGAAMFAPDAARVPRYFSIRLHLRRGPGGPGIPEFFADFGGG
jgi:hypothetical protein